MEQRTHISLGALNTFQVDASAERYARFDTQDEIPGFLKENPLEGQRHLVLGGGSNLLFLGDYAGVVLHPALRGIEAAADGRDHVRVRAMAGENWDDLVAFAVSNGWGGLENLSRIPGSVGASVIQNIGAYGMEVKDVVEAVEAVSLRGGEGVTLAAGDCGFGYRHSRFKGPWSGRYIVTAVVLRLSRRPRFVLTYPGVREAAEGLGPLSLETVRKAVIDIRGRRLPDPARAGNAGSFFKNPVVDDRRLRDLLQRFPAMPHYPRPGGGSKIAAGWMIERCGWKGRTLGRAGVSDQQALVLVNLGGASGREIFDLSQRVRRSVWETFGVALEREVVVVR